VINTLTASYDQGMRPSIAVSFNRLLKNSYDIDSHHAAFML
jgi:hypothetical protein